jgi:hypothetical protein
MRTTVAQESVSNSARTSGVAPREHAGSAAKYLTRQGINLGHLPTSQPSYTLRI